MFISLHLNAHVWSHSVLYQGIEFDCHRPWRAWLEKRFFQIRLAKKNNIAHILSLQTMLNVESFQLLLRMPLLLLPHPSVIHELKKKKKSTLFLMSAFVREALPRNPRGKTSIMSRLILNTFSSMIWSETETESKFDQPQRSTDDRRWESLTSSQRVKKKPLKWALVHEVCRKRNERVLFSFFNQRNTFSTN